MRADAIVFGIAGSLFGLIIGWVLGTQNATRHGAGRGAGRADGAGARRRAGSAAARPARPGARAGAADAWPRRIPRTSQSRVQLGNMFFDAEQYPQAITWYEQAIALNPADTNVSTDLGVAYYYTNQPDRALAQFDKSLAIDPKHIKTLLNVGIVRAFGKNDLAGAAKAWEAGGRHLAGFARRTGRQEGARRREERRGRDRGEIARAALPPAARPVLGDRPLVLAIRRGRGAGRDACRRPAARAAAAGPSPVKMQPCPVCGTYVVPGKAISTVSNGAPVHFCSEKCRSEYTAR